MRDIIGHKPLPSALLPLRPKFDEQAVLRVHGRLTYHKDLPIEHTPPLLPKHSALAKHWMYSVHAFGLEHTGGKQTLQALTRAQVWIIGSGEVAKQITRNCPKCLRRAKMEEIRLPLPPLHFSRLPHTAKPCAFNHVSVDHFGSYLVKHAGGRASARRWILVFSCLHTRAINFETVISEGTYRTRLAFMRHCAEYGGPDYINSDQGSGFIGLKNDLHVGSSIELYILL